MADGLSVFKSEFPLETCPQLKTVSISTCLGVSMFCTPTPLRVDAGGTEASARSVTSEKLQNTAFGGAFVTSGTHSQQNNYNL